MSFNPFPGAFGLDIAEDALRLVQLEFSLKGLRQPHINVRVLREATLPDGALTDGELTQPETVVRVLRTLLGQGKERLRSPYVFASLPEHRTFVKVVKVKPTNTALTKEDVESAIVSHVPYAPDDVYLDWQVVPGARGKNGLWSVIVAAAPKTIVDSYTYLLEIAGLEPLGLEVEALAVARLIVPPPVVGQEVSALVHLGEVRSSFLVLKGGVVHMSLSIPFSGHALTQKIATHLAVSPADAAQLKQTCGMDRADECDPKLRPLITETVTELTRRIREAMWFYKMQVSEGEPIDKLELTGSGAAMEGLDRALSSALKRKIRAINPYSILGGGVADDGRVQALLPFSTALGLALRALRGPLPVALS